MNILILGSGGREHALAWKIAQSEKTSQLFVAPGNGGTDQIATNVADLSVTDFEGIASFCISNSIEMLVVGPEDPLVLGIVDYFNARKDLSHIMCIGPNKEAATLEGSKEYCKEFMKKYDIPTAAYQSFTKDTIEDAYIFMESLNSPYVLKADGLAAGKGVLIIEDLNEAKAELNSMLNGKFGAASSKVVIEEFLDGIEFSVFALTDGSDYVILPVAKDYKRIGEGDTGLNTGGMGAVSPVSFVTAELMKKVEEQIVKPTINGFKSSEMDYRGFVFFGLIKVGSEPKVIEYNVRLGDPETEVVLPRINSDLVDLLASAAKKDLKNKTIEISEESVCTVMCVSQGYPEAYEKLKEIKGLDTIDSSIVFHAGTKKQDATIVSNGGRVLAVSSYGVDKDDALRKSYQSISQLSFEGLNFRKDIGFVL